MTPLQGFVTGVATTLLATYYFLKVREWWEKRSFVPEETVCEQETQKLPQVDTSDPMGASPALARFGEAYSAITGEPYTIAELWCLYNRLVRNPEHYDRESLELEEQP